ncbi:MAG TPA: tol-pal system protein YbgF [Candidatus Binatia bacterium]|nr:tol-pal system protein YbgF [Candidatus Binatia bacterium]
MAQLAPARADEVSDLRQQVEQLKQQMALLQNQMPGSGAGGGTIAAQQVVQMQQMSQQMSQLQGQIEQLGIKVDDLSQRLDRMQKDTEFRLGRLEGTGGAMPGAPVAGAPGDQAPAGQAPAGQAPAGQAAQVMSQGGQPLPQSADQMDANNQQAGLPGPEGTQQIPQPTAPGTLGTLPANAPLPQAPAGAAEAAAAAAGQSTAPAATANQNPSSIVLPGNTPQEQYDYSTGLLQRGAYAEAELALKAFVAQHPKDPLAGNAQYWLGETYYARSDFQNAAVTFAQGYQKYPKSSKAPDNLLKLGMSLGQIGQKDNACTAFKQLAKQFPTASAAIKDRAARAQQRYGCTAG